MEHLDRENHQEACDYTLIGGSACNLTRQPSSLLNLSSAHSSAAVLPEKCPRCLLRKKKKGRSALGSSSSNEEVTFSLSGSSPDSGGTVLKWDEEDVIAWLREIGLEFYEVR